MSNKLIDFINISKSYGTQTVLDDLNLYIRENEFLTLLVQAAAAKQRRFVFWADLKLPTAVR